MTKQTYIIELERVGYTHEEALIILNSCIPQYKATDSIRCGRQLVSNEEMYEQQLYTNWAK